MNEAVEVFAIKIDANLDQSKFDRLIAFVSDEKRERIKKFYRTADAQRTLVSDILVRYLMCKKLNLKNKHLIFDKNAFGKPFLVNFDDIHFNISHSGEWVVCATHNLPVGIDIELIQPIDFYIAERFFSRDEVKYLMTKNQAKKIFHFYELWTLKESYIKAIGKGMSIPLEAFTIIFGKGNITVKTENQREDYYFKQYDINDEYKMAVCANKDIFYDTVSVIEIKKLYEEVMFL